MDSSRSPLWLPELAALLRGIAHGVSNRVTALGALIELGDAETAEGREGILAELKRLQELNVLLKQLAAEPRPAEAMTLSDPCTQAARLHALRLDLRTQPCAVESEGDVAVRADRVRLMRLLLVLMARSARRANGALRLVVSGDDVEARMRLTGVAAAPAGDGAELQALAAELGGRVEEAPGEALLVLPSLQELRRRERAG